MIIWQDYRETWLHAEGKLYTRGNIPYRESKWFKPIGVEENVDT